MSDIPTIAPEGAVNAARIAPVPFPCNILPLVNVVAPDPPLLTGKVPDVISVAAIVIVFDDVLIVLFVKTCVSDIPTIAPEGAVSVAKTVPVPFPCKILPLVKLVVPEPPLLTGKVPDVISVAAIIIVFDAELIVLFVKTCVSVVPTIAPDGAVKVASISPVPFPCKILPDDKVVAPIPPLLTGKVPVTALLSPNGNWP